MYVYNHIYEQLYDSLFWHTWPTFVSLLI